MGIAVASAGAADGGRPPQSIARAVDSEASTAVEFLERIIGMNSGTFNRPGVHEVGKVFEAEFRALGFRTRWVSMDSVGRAPHLVAEHDGRRGKRVLLIGHMDTVFEPSSSFQQFVRHGDTAVGPGVVDDKGGVVVMLSALKALKAVGGLEGARITAFITADEEHPGAPVETARAEFINAGKHADATLCFEAGIRVDGQDFVSTARRGASSWTVLVNAHSAHSGAIFTQEVGDGSIFELSRILNRFHDELREPDMTFSVGLAVGGAGIQVDPAGGASADGKDNIVPSKAQALGDIRALRPEQVTRIKERMQAIVAASLPGTKSEITFEDGYPPMAPTAGNTALLERYSEASEALGFGRVRALDPMRRGAGDSAFVAPYVDTISGLGAVGDGMHTNAETVDLRAFPMQAKRAALLIYRLTRGS
ncbi:MAG TPA: M20/M25/M40 family metallo-hydrolase [Steroidobacteraceae bacterium]|nr:M20/M25/M40 family metallo-hydrolase [Steroidobacteraceae bacterium]